jgi:2-polyprenyl-6-hydroxyphenyl methylase/3-demethylubiquinone-9 3-methyltransferase
MNYNEHFGRSVNQSPLTQSAENHYPNYIQFQHSISVRSLMKSYYDAHESAYQGIKSNGYVGWGNKKTLSELGDPSTVEYLTTSLLQHAGPISSQKNALDLGCGTGTTAFKMAEMGFSVTGIDISPTAIEMARDLATQQNLNINFMVGDILQLENLNQKFDVIYDSHCLHCIVFEEDRQRVLSGVKNSLTDSGIFILDTAIATDKTVFSNDGLRFDEDYILWHKTKPSTARGVVEVDGQHWCAQRRFYPAAKVKEEIAQVGFKVLSTRFDTQDQDAHGMLRLILQR